MARKCCVLSCLNTYSKTKNICVIDEKYCTLTVITYHSFPRQPYLRQKWIEATGRTNWEPSNGSYICSEHFKESDYDMIKQKKLPENDDQLAQVKRILKRNAIPTQQIYTVSKREVDVYPKGNHFDAPSCSELSDLSSIQGDIKYTAFTNIDLNKVKEEPISEEENVQDQQHPPFIITSAVTVKEENDYCDRQNGGLESSTNYSNSNHVDSRCDYSFYNHKPERLKHQDSLIAPEDIKVERCMSPLNFSSNLSIEEKYERLLDEYLKLKRDYDLMKFKLDIQSDAINKCEHILKGCR